MTATYADWVRDRSCTGKRAYDSQYEARCVVLQHWQRGDDAREYRCDYGEHWHVTTRTEEAE